VAVPSQLDLTGIPHGTNTSNLYDAAGANSLVAKGNKVTLRTPVSTIVVSHFDAVNAYQQNGSSDTTEGAAVGYSLQTIGHWTSA